MYCISYGYSLVICRIRQRSGNSGGDHRKKSASNTCMRIYKLKTMAVSMEGLPHSGSGVLIGMSMKRVPVPLFLLYSLGLLLVPLIAAQPGFISIDCGSNSNYTDSKTGLVWTTDDGYISTGSNHKVTTLVQTDNSQQMSTARLFQERRTKNCYRLPVTLNSSYLIRAVFLYGDLDVSPQSSYSFNLSIDSTMVGYITITPSNIDVPIYFELFVASTSNQIAFCLIPDVGNPFISSLELRPLQPTMYQGLVFKSKYMSTSARYNFGAPTDSSVRFPDDTYDRLWFSSARSINSTVASISTTATNLLDPTSDYPPLKVMQTAWIGNWPNGFLITLSLAGTSTTNFLATMYFAEIGKPKATDVRCIDVYVNGIVWYTGYNVTGDMGELQSIGPKSITTSVANFTVLPNKASTLPPILNGMEFHGVYDSITTTTDTRDVAALYDLHQSLNIHPLDSTGDPCLPVPFDWLNCSNRDPPTITQLKLSGYQLRGTIPPSIVELSDLTDLWLDSNLLTGSIPNLAGLVHLRTLHLQNNSLIGSIPASLVDTPNLSELFLKDNKLSGPVPTGLLHKPGLNLQVDSVLIPAKSPGGSPKSGISGAVIGAIIGVVVVVILLIVGVLFFWCRRKNKAKTQPQRETNGSKIGGPSNHHVQMTRAFSHVEVQDATNNFKRKIGEGGFGPVYYGRLASQEEVAVKVNSATSGQGLVEFSTEVNLLSRVHHKNLVSLVGFCDEDGQKILLYEYMQNGTLREHLYDKGLVERLPWRIRLDIALNAARGLEYLHYDCNPKIIHRDVKSSNILLNEKLLAKVADFGISKQTLDEDTTRTTGVSTIVRATPGYLDPEYFSTNKVTYKSDVYAFGVVLLEIISGRAPNDDKLVDTYQWNLVQYARGMLRDGNLDAIVDPSILGSYNVESMWKLAELAMYCVEPLSMNRPDMRQVVREVVEAINLENVQGSTAVTSAHVGRGDMSSLLVDDTQSSYPSYPSTQSSQPNASSGTHNYTTSEPSPPWSLIQHPSNNSDSWNKPRAR